MIREDEWLDAIDLTRKQEAEIAALKAERDRMCVAMKRLEGVKMDNDRLTFEKDELKLALLKLISAREIADARSDLIEKERDQLRKENAELKAALKNRVC